VCMLVKDRTVNHLRDGVTVTFPCLSRAGRFVTTVAVFVAVWLNGRRSYMPGSCCCLVERKELAYGRLLLLFG
jgi:hypothetical protein